MLTYRLVLLVSLFTLFFTACSELPEKDVEGVSYTIKTYTKESQNTEHIPFDKENLNLSTFSDLGFFRGNIWIELKLVNSTEKEKSIVVANNNKLSHNYSLYKKDILTGDLILSSKKVDPKYRDGRSFNFSQPNFKINIDPKETAYYYLHSTSDGRVVQCKTYITSLDDFMQIMNRETQINTFFYGSLFVIFLFNIFFWSSFKNKIHGYYSMYVLCTLLLYSGFEGYLHSRGVQNHLVDHAVFILLRAMLLSLVLFTATFLKINSLAPRFYKWIKRIMFSVMLLTTSYQLISFNSSIKNLHYVENIISFIWIIVVLILLGLSLRQKRIEVRYYLVALFVYLLFIIAGELSTYINFMHQIKFDCDSFYKIGSAIEVLIFTYTIIKVLGLNEQSIIKESQIYLNDKNRIESENHALKAKLQDSGQQRMEFLSILKLIESNLNNEEDWTEFKNKVNEINPEFLKSLQATHQELSKNDLRLLLLVKMGFTQNEIAGMLFIAESSVKKSKQRIRKKLKIPTKITLSEFLSKF